MCRKHKMCHHEHQSKQHGCVINYGNSEHAAWLVITSWQQYRSYGDTTKIPRFHLIKWLRCFCDLRYVFYVQISDRKSLILWYIENRCNKCDKLSICVGATRAGTSRWCIANISTRYRPIRTPFSQQIIVSQSDTDESVRGCVVTEFVAHPASSMFEQWWNSAYNIVIML